MNITQEQKNEALTIIYAYSELRRQTENIEKALGELNDRKDQLMGDLEKLRSVETELIDKIKEANADVEFSATDLIEILYKAE